MTNRGMRAVTAASAALALSTGCQPPGAAAEPRVLNVKAVADRLNCNGSAAKQVGNTERYDIDRDGQQEWFFVFRCPDAVRNGEDIGDQIEVVDGDSYQDLAHPVPMAGTPLVHEQDHFTMAGGCLVFRDATVFIAERLPAGSPNAPVVKIGTWQGRTIQVTAPPRGTTNPCRAITDR